MWTKREQEVLDQLIEREERHAATPSLSHARSQCLERAKVLKIARMIGMDAGSIGMAKAAERFWHERAVELEREAEEAKRHYGNQRN